MPDTDTILIPPDAYQWPTLRFVAASALSGCTHTAARAHGEVAVIANWPAESFSRGEQVLWRLLEGLTSGDLRTALARLDANNVVALRDVVAALAAKGLPEPGRCTCGADGCADVAVTQ